MADVTVDLDSIGKRILLGRDNGQAARVHFDLDQYSPDVDRIKLTVSPKISGKSTHVNSSFFLGMFAKDIQSLNTSNAFFSYVDIGEIPDYIQPKIKRAVDIALAEQRFR